MTDLRTAAQQALEALHSVEWHGGSSAWMLNDCKVEGAIHALRAALAEPEHEIIQRMRRLKAEAQAEHRQAIEQGRCSSCGQELPEELKTEYKADDDLLTRITQLEAQVGLPAKDPRAPTVAMRLDAIEMQDFERADALLARNIGALQDRIDKLERNAAMQKLTDIQQEMERTGCDHCNSPLWCGTKCKSCGKVWEWASGIEG